MAAFQTFHSGRISTFGDIQGLPASVGSDNGFQGTVSTTTGTNGFTIVATDASGNVRTQQYSVDVSGPSRTLTYDANGNLQSDGTRTFQWDARNQLVSATSGSQQVVFEYNGISRRTRAVTSASGVIQTDRHYVWMGQEIAQERIGATTRELFTSGVFDGATATFYTRDHLGSVTSVSNQDASQISTFVYDPYGRVDEYVR